MLLYSFLSLLLLHTSFALVIPPKSTSNAQENALLILPASGVNHQSYLPLVHEIQAHHELPLWVGLSESAPTSSDSALLSNRVNSLHSEMVSEGMAKDTPLFLGGHSDGGDGLLDYMHAQNRNLRGYILMGSFVKRVHYSDNYQGQRILTLLGDLDGLVRVTRIAQSFYHLVKQQEDLFKFPHIIMPGLSHLSFISGEAPHSLKDKDFEAEVDEADALEMIAQTIAEFMRADFKSKQGLFLKAMKSKQFLDPIIDALTLEANYALKPACYQVKDGQDCWEYNPWTRDVANTKMASLNSSYTLNMKDILWPAATVFPHDYLPEVKGKCETGAFPCTLNITSVTENIYHNDTNKDLGDTPIAAFEMRAKIAARQKIWQPAGVPNADDFDYTDDGNLCGAINQQALDYALSHADAEVVKRYNEKGIKLEIGDDEGPYNEGPIWIWINLDYKEADSKMTVRSPMMRTPTNYWIWLSAGFHFCKLLSPAKAMEWVYYDSLKTRSSVSV